MYNELLTQEQNDRLNHSIELTANQELDEIEAKQEENDPDYDEDIKEAQTIINELNMKDLEEEANYSEVEDLTETTQPTESQPAESQPTELKPFTPYALPMIPVM